MARLASATLRVGDTAPAFALTTLDGQRVELAGLLSHGAVLLVFAPGVWSPNVRRQLVELATAYERFVFAGIQVFMVVTQDRRRIVERLTYVSPPFTVLTDERRVAARDYGVYRALSFDGIGVTRPAAFLVDADGVLRLVYVGEGDSDVIDVATLVQLSCWLVGVPEAPEAAPLKIDAEEAIAEAESALVMAAVGAALDGETDEVALEAAWKNGGFPLLEDEATVAMTEVAATDDPPAEEASADTESPAAATIDGDGVAAPPTRIAGDERGDGQAPAETPQAETTDRG